MSEEESIGRRRVTSDEADEYASGAAMSEVFDPNKVERWNCQAGQMLDGGTVAVMVGADDGEYVYAWQFDQLLALYRQLQNGYAASIEARSGGIKNPQP